MQLEQIGEPHWLPNLFLWNRAAKCLWSPTLGTEKSGEDTALLFCLAPKARDERNVRARKIASEGILRFGGACMKKQDSKVGGQWSALEVGSTRPLAIPT